MTDAVPAPAAPTAGKTLGIVGLVLVFFATPLGLILSIVAKVQSRGAGVKNTPATVGIVLGILFIVVGITIAILVFTAIGAQCAQLGPGAHSMGNGVTVTCG